MHIHQCLPAWNNNTHAQQVLWFNESIATRDVTSCSKDVCATKQVDVCSTTARIGAQVIMYFCPETVHCTGT
jgi:hypothetical protein